MENNLTPPEKQRKTGGFGKKFRRILRVFTLLFFIFLAVFIYWKYFYNFSEGNRAGLLQKFSKKGTFFKTYEGEMILSSVRGIDQIAIASEKFLFTVVDDSVAAEIDKLQGQNIIVRYTEYNGTLPWRGDSKYIVDSVGVAHNMNQTLRY